MATGTRTAPTDPAPPEPDQIVEKELPAVPRHCAS